MLKHILTGQPSSGGTRHHHSDYQTSVGSLSAASIHHHSYSSGRLGSVVPRNGCDVYDSVGYPATHNQRATAQAAVHHHPSAATPSSAHRHSLNHSQLSVNNLSQRLHHTHNLNLSTLSASKHSVGSISPVVGNITGNNTANISTTGNNANNSAGASSNSNNTNNNNNSTTINNNGTTPGHATLASQVSFHQDHRPKVNGGLDISRMCRLPSQATPSPTPAVCAPVAVQVPGVATVIPLNGSWSSSSLSRQERQEAGVKEMITSLGLLCLVSLLLALLSLIFLLKISPLTITSTSFISPEEYTIVYEVTLALCALALSLNLCCLLVCAIQFLFAVKLVKISYQENRSNMYLQKSSISRICAVGGFFISIPVFLTGMILYTFIQFHSTPAIVTSVFIGLGIVFCGCAMVHNVFVWQREKTNAVKALAREQCEAAVQLQRQQHQQQQQQQQQLFQPSHQYHQSQAAPQLRSATSLTHHQDICSPKIGTLSAAHSNATLGSHIRNSSSHHLHHHHHRHLSPTLHSVRLNGITTPTTPGDRCSSPSPVSNNNNNSKLNRSQHHLAREASGSVSPGLPVANHDLSSAATTNSPHELSTLV